MMLTKYIRTLSPKTRLVLLTALVYGTPLLLYSLMPFTKDVYGDFRSSLVNILFYERAVFSPLGLIFDMLLLYCGYTLIFGRNIIVEEQRVYHIFQGIRKILRSMFIDNLRNPLPLSRDEKVSVLFYFVKIFFTPLMLKFVIGNAVAVISAVSKGPQGFGVKAEMLGHYFPLALRALLVIDTVIFSFGYLVESKKLDSVVKSVEPTVLGWAATLICYPPVNGFSGNILGWYTSDFGEFGNVDVNIFFGILSVLLFVIYVWASIALGPKASNLTNLGIVSSGPYRYVRHPAYVSKNLAWWVMGVPFIMSHGLVAILSLSAWSAVYFVRAITEERHLMQDKDYVDYMKKVRYMFIPGIF